MKPYDRNIFNTVSKNIRAKSANNKYQVLDIWIAYTRDVPSPESWCVVVGNVYSAT